MADARNLVQRLDGQVAGMTNTRYSWWLHWQDLANFILPRRYQWLITPNQWGKGSPVNQNILDSTGTISARNCAGGMMGGICSPTDRWFRLKVAGQDDLEQDAKVWLTEVERRVMYVLAQSNFYDSMAVMFFDLVVFGTAAVLIEEDYDDVIRCFNPALGEYFFAVNDKFRVDTFAREFVLTVSQMVQWFGKDNCSTSVQELYRQGREGLSTEVTVRHLIEPNSNNDRTALVPKRFKYRSIYWERGNAANQASGTDKVLQARGYNEWPGMTPRWDVTANEPYGRSPGMDALGDIKQLQLETRRKAQAIDKMVNPPTTADVQLKNQPVSFLPGGVTFVAGQIQGNAGVKPIYQIQPPIQEMKEDIAEVQKRIQNIFYNDLFMMISQLQTVRSATEIDARKEEKLVMLGPVLERLQDEGFDPGLTRVLGIMTRAQLIPPPPDSMRGQTLEISYVNMLAEAQKAAQTAGMERYASILGNLTGVIPTAIDNLNEDDFASIYADLLGVDPRVVASKEQLTTKRKERADVQQNQEMMNSGLALAKGAKTLSDTQVGGGQNALAAMSGM